MAADYTKIHRLLRLIILMQSGDAGNADALAAELGVTTRTVFRDLRVLTDLGIPHALDEATGTYRIRGDFFLPPVQLTAGETLALLSLTQHVGGQEQVPLTGPAAKAIEKIKNQIPDRVLAELGDLDAHIGINLAASGPAGEAIRDVFSQIGEAIRTRRALLCRYESVNGESGESPFHFHPYKLSFEQRAWYAIGHHEGRGEVRRLKLNRFTGISHTDRPYGIPDDFSLEAFRGKAWRMIRGDRLFKIAIRFDPGVAEAVADTNWHTTQQVEDHPDGSITFHCEVEGLDEIVWWVLGYGPHAKVLEPPELIERVHRLISATANIYDDSRKHE